MRKNPRLNFFHVILETGSTERERIVSLDFVRETVQGSCYRKYFFTPVDGGSMTRQSSFFLEESHTFKLRPAGGSVCRSPGSSTLNPYNRRSSGASARRHHAYSCDYGGKL